MPQLPTSRGVSTNRDWPIFYWLDHGSYVPLRPDNNERPPMAWPWHLGPTPILGRGAFMESPMIASIEVGESRLSIGTERGHATMTNSPLSPELLSVSAWAVTQNPGIVVPFAKTSRKYEHDFQIPSLCGCGHTDESHTKGGCTGVDCDCTGLVELMDSYKAWSSSFRQRRRST